MNSITKIMHVIYLKLKERFDPTKPATQEEKYCAEICVQLINNPTSRLTYAPISNKRFIKNDDKSIFVVINYRTVNIINHVYGYNIFIEDESLLNQIISSFDGVLEAKRQELEAEMTANVRHSLQKILDKVS